MEWYPVILFTHSWVRYLVVLLLVCTAVRALYAWRAGVPYTGVDGLLCRSAVAVAHLQVVLGFGLYVVSPLTMYVRAHFRETIAVPESLFFGVLHGLFMLTAVIVLTIGGSLARRSPVDAERFRLVSVYFFAALLLIALAIPWPFSPLAARPWLRF